MERNRARTTFIHRNSNFKICLTTDGKPTDQQNYLHLKLARSSSLKKSIPYSQALHISSIYTETNERSKELAEKKESFS